MQSTFNDYAMISDPGDRAKVAALEPLFLIVSGQRGQGNMGATLAECAAKAGMKRKTFQNRYYAWVKNGAIGAADKRKIARCRRTPDVLGVFKTYCERMSGDCHIHAAAWRRMMADFRQGKLFPSVGTWREVYRAEYGEWVVVPPYCPAQWIPQGWTYANLMMRLGSDPAHLASLAWNQRGMYSAAKYVMDVVRSRWDAENRRQLAAGAVYQWDDAWENNLVMLPGVKGAFRPLGFHCYDIGTGYHLYPFMKPRTYTKVEGQDRVKGDNLTEQMFRMAFAFVHCVIGFSKHGVMHVLENGTTAIREPVRERIKCIPEFGALIKFSSSAAQTMPAHQGLFAGAVGGNPKFKSTVEGAHRFRQLEMAHLPSAVGNSADNKPESLATWQKHEEKFLAALDLAAIPPEILKIAEKRLPLWDEYYSLACATFDAINDYTYHKLEGWHDYYKQEFRDPDDPHTWHPMAVLDHLTPTSVERIESMIAVDAADMVRSRRMSRREAWQSWVERGEFVRVPLSEMQFFMDPRDAKELTVTPKRTIKFKDATYYGEGVEMEYSAVATDRNGIPHMLAPGTKVRVYFNCWGNLINYIWVADMDDKPIGQCDLKAKSFWGSPEMIREAAKQKIIDQANLLHDTRSRHFDAAAEKLANEWSQKMLVEVAADVKSKPIAVKGPRATLEELAYTESPSFERDVEMPEASDDDDMNFLTAMNKISAHDKVGA